LSIQSIFLKDPYLLVPFLVVTTLILVWLWDQRRTRLTARLAIGGIASIPVLTVVELIVVTDRERVRSVCEALAGAVNDADLTAFADLVWEGFRIGSGDRAWNKADLLAQCEKTLSKWDIDEACLSRFEITVTDGTATASFQATCRLISADFMVPRYVSTWDAAFVRQEGSWLLSAVSPRRSHTFPFDSLSDLRP